MNSKSTILLFGLSLFLVVLPMRAQISATTPSSDGTAPTSANIRKETTEMIKADARRILGSGGAGEQGGSQMDPRIESIPPAQGSHSRVPEIVETPNETPFVHFLRTGIIQKNTGRRVTTTLAAGPTPAAGGFAAMGLALSFRW